MPDIAKLTSTQGRGKGRLCHTVIVINTSQYQRRQLTCQLAVLVPVPAVIRQHQIQEPLPAVVPKHRDGAAVIVVRRHLRAGALWQVRSRCQCMSLSVNLLLFKGHCFPTNDK
jgi:hypothetical protein